mgnify:FL=1
MPTGVALFISSLLRALELELAYLVQLLDDREDEES